LYEAADQLGLLVWQEAMFSCSPYPRHAAFLANVEAEVTQQLLRLGSHASLALLGGNNEVEQSLGWFAQTRANAPLYALDYAALFVDTIGAVARQVRAYAAWQWVAPGGRTCGLVDTHRTPQWWRLVGHVRCLARDCSSCKKSTLVCSPLCACSCCRACPTLTAPPAGAACGCQPR
jgi:hypothetical protein